MNELDINSRMPGNAGILSNLHKHPFFLNDLYFGSIEGFLQGLRVQCPEFQKVVFGKHGIEAKRFGKVYPIKNQTLFYRGVAFNRHSEYYSNIVSSAYDACFDQNRSFQKAIFETKDMTYIHTVGKTDPFDTILTNDEFIGNLLRLRKKLGY